MPSLSRVVHPDLVLRLFSQIKVKAVSRKFTLLRGVNFKISLDFALHICKQTGQKSKSIAYTLKGLRKFEIIKSPEIL